MLPVVSSPPGPHVYPHHGSHEIPHQRLTTPTIHQFYDRTDIPPHNSYHTSFQSAAATLQFNTLSPEYAPFPADPYYTSIPTNSPTESTISSGSAIPNPPLFGQTEGASVLNSANEGPSNWLCDPTIPHPLQGGSYTGPILDYFDISPIPVTAAVPQALASAHGGEPGPELSPRFLADLHEFIAPGPPVSVELSRYQNYPVAPVEISGISIVQQRREVATWLTLDLSSVPTHNAKPWSAVRISRTPSVHAHRDSPLGVNVLGVDIVVSGAETHKEYTEACDSCKARRGAGPMVDYRSKTNLVEVTKGRVRLRFVFCCYPADRDQEKYYRVDVVLSERLTDGQQHVIVRKQLPYYFDVYSRRMVERASDLEDAGAAPDSTTPTS